MLAKVLIGIGLALVGLGLLLYFVPGALGWFGRLPGDINVERGNSRFFFPVTSMIIISIVLTVLINLFFRR